MFFFPSPVSLLFLCRHCFLFTDAPARGEGIYFSKRPRLSFLGGLYTGPQNCLLWSCYGLRLAVGTPRIENKLNKLECFLQSRPMGGEGGVCFFGIVERVQGGTYEVVLLFQKPEDDGELL